MSDTADAQVASDTVVADVAPDLFDDFVAGDDGGDIEVLDDVAAGLDAIPLVDVRVPAALDEFGGIVDLPVRNESGFFRPVLMGDRWILASPAGNAFLSMGVNHIVFEGDHSIRIASRHLVCHCGGFESGHGARRGFCGPVGI